MPDLVDLVDLIDAMTAEERRGALAVLDAVSRPLLPKKIEAALYSRGTSLSQRKAIVGAIKGFRIIATVGPEGDDPRGEVQSSQPHKAETGWVPKFSRTQIKVWGSQ